MKPKKKWKFAIGTTSRVPDSGGLHYLIADFDCGVMLPLDSYLKSILSIEADVIIFQRTKNGWHLYTDIVMTLDRLVCTLEDLRADKSWIKIGQQRGYYFLADKDEIDFPYPVEHMVLHYEKKKT